MIYRLEVAPLPGHPDARGAALLHSCARDGIYGVEEIRVVDLYLLEGELSAEQVGALGRGLLADQVVEQLTWLRVGEGAPPTPGEQESYVEVCPLPGVTDSVAESLLEAAHARGFTGLRHAATGTRYELRGAGARAAAGQLAARVSNPVVQSSYVDVPIRPPLMSSRGIDERVDHIPLRGLEGEELLALSRARRLSLDGAEMAAIQAWFSAQGRDPTDLELEMIAQTWSEHCVHKTFRALIDHREVLADGAVREEQIDGLLKQYIRAATEQIDPPWLRSAFVDNAGIVAFDEDFDLAFKVETHNHPSALEPFGGANTGVGGVVRDVLGVSARPIANLDVLLFGPLDLPAERLPAGVLHPARVFDGVTAGIGDYGNKMGIPTVAGAISYHPGYLANPLVYCGCLGLLPTGSHPRAPQVGDLIVVLGGRTGRDGLRGATFSSMEMDHATTEIAGSAVQIGHPIHEKQVMEVVLAARDERLYHAITDCGAGGLSSAVGEMASELGARVSLDEVPLKYDGLRPWEVWLSEAQERMVMAVPLSGWERLQVLCRRHEVEATAIGAFTGDGVLRVLHSGRQVGALGVDFLHSGIPRRRLRSEWVQAPTSAPPAPPEDPGALLLELLASPEIRSREEVIRRYDHEVQGATVLRPLVGVDQHGPGEGAVLVPLHVLKRGAGPARGVAVGVGLCPRVGELDPYAMAWAAIDEALRNVVAMGADPDQVSILDNFCWGNPTLPDRLGALVRCTRGCYDAAVAHRAPFISGKDSLNNEYTGADGRKHAIPGTLLISALGIVPDARVSPTTDLKQVGGLLYALGETHAELGGSAWYALRGQVGGAPPQPCLSSPGLLRALHAAILKGVVRACHDLSDGGLGVAAAEMAVGGRCGAELELSSVPASAALSPTELLFSESAGRFLVEIHPDDAQIFEATLAGHACARVGRVCEGGRLRFHLDGRVLVDQAVEELERAFRG